MVKKLVKKLAMNKEEKWARFYALRLPEIEDKASSQKAIVGEDEKSWKCKKLAKAKKLEVEGEGTGNELKGKGNEATQEDNLGSEHASSMSSDEDMMAEMDKHLEAVKKGTEDEHLETLKDQGAENELEGEGSGNEQFCSACGQQRPERGIVECKACGSKN